MTWTNPTALAAAARTNLAACAAWVTEVTDALKTARVHYPKSDPATDDLTHALFVPGGDTRRRFAEGAKGLISGTFVWEFYFDESANTIGEVETFAEDIIDQIVNQDTGLPITDAERIDPADEPQQGDVSGGTPMIVLAIECRYGLDGGE